MTEATSRPVDPVSVLSPLDGGGGRGDPENHYSSAPTAVLESVESTITGVVPSLPLSTRADGLDHGAFDTHSSAVEAKESAPSASGLVRTTQVLPMGTDDLGQSRVDTRVANAEIEESVASAKGAVISNAQLPTDADGSDQSHSDLLSRRVGTEDTADQCGLDTHCTTVGGEKGKRGHYASVTRSAAAPLPLPDLHRLLRHYAQTVLDFQKARIEMGNRVGALERDGFDPLWSTPVATAAESMEAAERALQRQLERLAKMHPLSDWIVATPGLGLLGFALVLGATGPLDAFPNVAKLWAYCGMDVKSDGRAPHRVKGVKLTPRAAGGEGAHSPQARMVCFRIGEAFVKCASSPYRAIYVAKKAEYLARERVGPSACPFGQIHLKNGKPIECKLAHAHAAARRAAVKRFLADMWEEWRRCRAGLESPRPSIA